MYCDESSFWRNVPGVARFPGPADLRTDDRLPSRWQALRKLCSKLEVGFPFWLSRPLGRVEFIGRAKVLGTARHVASCPGVEWERLGCTVDLVRLRNKPYQLGDMQLGSTQNNDF